jgi:hypothetical protein
VLDLATLPWPWGTLELSGGIKRVGVAQLVERVLYHSTRRAVPERSWVQSLLPSTEVEPGFSTFGGMLVPVLQLMSPVCKTGTSLGIKRVHHPFDGQCGHFGYGSEQEQGVPRLRGPIHLTPGSDTPSQPPFRLARVQLGAPAMGADAEQR